MLMPPGPTMQTTYSVRLLIDGQWTWYSGGEYESEDDVHELLAYLYGGSFAGSNMHQIIKSARTIVPPRV